MNSGTTRENKQVKRVSLYPIKLMNDSGRALWGMHVDVREEITWFRQSFKCVTAALNEETWYYRPNIPAASWGRPAHPLHWFPCHAPTLETHKGQKKLLLYMYLQINLTLSRFFSHLSNRRFRYKVLKGIFRSNRCEVFMQDGNFLVIVPSRRTMQT